MVDRCSITCVIDWTNARIGDVRADFARTYSLLHWVPLPGPISSKQWQDVRATFCRAWTNGYRDIAGPLPNLAPFLTRAAALLEFDLGRTIGLPGFWLTSEDLRQIHRQQVPWGKGSGLQIEE
jgi:hypothetical protein